MKQRFRLYRRNKHSRAGQSVFYLEDTHTGKRASLHTANRQVAQRLLHAHREAHEQPFLNYQIARTYLLASDPAMVKRTWADVMAAILAEKSGESERRWETAIKDRALDGIRHKPLLETRAEHFHQALNTGTVSTNVFLRRTHNFAQDMGWLLAPVIPKRRFPKPVFKQKRAITLEEHQKIMAREKNVERRTFYELAWHTGASQSNLANLHAEDIDWNSRVISYERMKLLGRAKLPPRVSIGPELEKLLRSLPATGDLFPYLRTIRSGDRATEFKQRCETVGISGVSLHSYRYAWAKRAKEAGYPERWAQIALGHSSKAMARHYSEGADVILPSLEDWTAENCKFLRVDFKSQMPMPKQPVETAPLAPVGDRTPATATVTAQVAG